MKRAYGRGCFSVLEATVGFWAWVEAVSGSRGLSELVIELGAFWGHYFQCILTMVGCAPGAPD